jgi:hypothetical protein
MEYVETLETPKNNLEDDQKKKNLEAEKKLYNQMNLNIKDSGAIINKRKSKNKPVSDEIEGNNIVSITIPLKAIKNGFIYSLFYGAGILTMIIKGLYF